MCREIENTKSQSNVLKSDNGIDNKSFTFDDKPDIYIRSYETMEHYVESYI